MPYLGGWFATIVSQTINDFRLKRANKLKNPNIFEKRSHFASPKWSECFCEAFTRIWLRCWISTRVSEYQFIFVAEKSISYRNVLVQNRYHCLDTCIYLPSLKTSYASEISLNLLFASSKLSGFLSGCHFNANFLYLRNENMPDIALEKLVTKYDWAIISQDFETRIKSFPTPYERGLISRMKSRWTDRTYAFLMSALLAVRCTSSTL